MSAKIIDAHKQGASTCLVPLPQLFVHPDNVRRTDKRADIEGLAASIAAHGLLQNLSVVRCEDRYGVVAGGRRLAALRLLAKTGRVARDFAAPCTIVDEAIGAEASLAENVQRVAMNAMDEMEAFAALVRDAMTVENVASRFGSTIRHVEQRLALAALSPKIRAAYRKGDVTLDVARAFCLASDHATQERVFKQMSKPITHTPSVRQALTQGRIPAQDRLAKFVGLEIYEAAGGRIVRDLFDEGVVFLDDGDLLHRLAGEKLDTLRESVMTEGWGWAGVQLGQGQIEGCASERLRPSRKKPSAKQAKAITALEAEIEALDEQLEINEDDEAVWTQRDNAGGKLTALHDALTVWDKQQMAHAGALIGIDRDGAPAITRGLIKRADFKALSKLQKTSAGVSSDEQSQAQVGTVASERRLPQALVERLTGLRTCALRSEIADGPKAALALLVHSMLEQSQRNGRVAGLGIATAPCALGDQDGLGERQLNLTSQAPGSFAQCLASPIDDLLAWLAVLVAETVNLTHRGAHGEDGQLQTSADTIASALGFDMARHWKVDEEFWLKAPKSAALKALEGAPKFAALPDDERAAAFVALSKLKKSDLAKIATAELGETNWLPEIIVTPPRTDDLVVTSDGEAELANQAA